MEDLILRYGLFAVLIGAAVEGDATMILVGVVAHLGLLDFPFAVALGTVGAMAADLAVYAIGRNRAETIRQTRLYRRAGSTVERLARRVGPWEVVCARFVYGTRSASMLLWGMWGLPLPRFVALDALGCALWATALGGVGFAVSGSAAMVMGKVKHVEVWLLTALLAAAATVAVARAILRRRRRREAGAARREAVNGA